MRLLPLLGACTAAYIVSFFLMENTIMTEKIARRGISTPDSFEPDILQKMCVSDVINDKAIVLSADNSIKEVRTWLDKNRVSDNYFILVDKANNYGGTLKITDLYITNTDENTSLGDIAVYQAGPVIKSTDTLHQAVQSMSGTNAEVLPILSASVNGKVIGVLTYKDIIKAYQSNISKNENLHVKISLKRRRMKMVIRGKKPAN
jgi:CIC family chloride channel protein